MKPKYLQSLIPILLGFSILFIFLFLFTSLKRIFFPFDLEWMEGVSLQGVFYWFVHSNIYLKPTLEYVPAAYPPLYTLTSALFASFLGFNLFSLRLVSLLSTLITMALIYLFVKKETNQYSYALISIGLFAAFYNTSGFWYDLARVDMLFIMFLTSSLYLTRFHKNIVSSLFAGLLFAFAFFTKQTTLYLIPFILFYYFLYKRDTFKYFLASLITVFAVLFTYFQVTSQGWFYYYVFTIPQGRWLHTLRPINALKFLIKDIVMILSPTIIIFVSYLSFCKKKEDKNMFSFYLLFFIGAMLASFLPRLEAGGYSNSLLPICTFLAISSGISIHALNRYWEDKPRKYTAIYCLVLLQFMILLYNPFNVIPEKQSTDYLFNKIKNLKGEVYIPYHSFYPYFSNKKTYAHAMCIRDILTSNDKEKSTLNNKITNALRNKYFGFIILDRKANSEWEYGKFTLQYYKEYLSLLNKKIPSTVTGKTTKPEKIYF